MIRSARKSLFFFVLYFSVFMPASGLLNAQERKLEFPLTRVWLVTAEEKEITNYATRVQADFIIHDNLLFAGSANGTMYCFDKRTGNSIWTFETAHPVNHNFALSQQAGLIFSSGSSLFCLNPITGEINWYTQLTVEPASNCVATGDAVCFYSGNSIFAYDVTSGALSWTYELPGEEDRFVSMLHADQKHLYAGSESGRVVKVKASDGSESWSVTEEAAVRSGFSILDQNLYYGTDSNYIVCADLSNGKSKWRQRLSGDVRSGITIEEDLLYFYSRDRFLRIYNAYHGGPSPFGPKNISTNYHQKPMVADGYLLVVDGARFNGYKIEQNISYISAAGTRAPISNSLAFDDETKILFAGCSNGDMAALVWEKMEVQIPEVRETQPIDVQPILQNNDNRQPKKPEEQEIKQETDQPDESASSPEADGQQKKETNGEKRNTEVVTEQPNQPERSQTPEVENAESESADDEPPINEHSEEPVEPSATDVSLSELISQQKFDAVDSRLRKQFAQNSAEHYTISVGLFCRDESLIRLRDHFQNSHQILLFKHTYQDQQCYFFCIDLYSDQATALDRLEDLKSNEPLLQTAKVHRLDSFIETN